MPEIRSLADETEEKLYGAFMEAFDDYCVPIAMTRAEFDENNRRRGLDLSLSLGAYEGQRLVGFIMNGRGSWGGRPAAYDLGTGVLPEARGSALAGGLASRLVALLPERGLELYVLEVIRDNIPALKTYRKAGFAITRRLECPAGDYAETERLEPDGLEIAEIPGGPAFPRAELAPFRDWEPSWQNSDDSIARMPGRLALLGARIRGTFAGYLVSSFKGTIWQFAVARERRRQGIGSALLRELAQRVGPSLRYVNVDAGDGECLRFLGRRGLDEGVGQYEMIRELFAR